MGGLGVEDPRFGAAQQILHPLIHQKYSDTKKQTRPMVPRFRSM